MNLAKATPEDCQKVWDLYHLVEELSEECEHEETREKLERAVRKTHQGVMGRVVFGMGTILENNVLDPDSKVLELHPDLKPEEIEPTELW